jgi:hypothetical protein
VTDFDARARPLDPYCYFCGERTPVVLIDRITRQPFRCCTDCMLLAEEAGMIRHLAVAADSQEEP